MKMANGDIVTIKDGSWSKSVVDGKLVHEMLAYSNEAGKEYVVVEIGCSFPLEDRYQPVYYRNDTVIQAVDSGKVVFIHESQLRLAIKPVREVTMAEVCARFGEEVKVIRE